MRWNSSRGDRCQIRHIAVANRDPVANRRTFTLACSPSEGTIGSTIPQCDPLAELCHDVRTTDFSNAHFSAADHDWI